MTSPTDIQRIKMPDKLVPVFEGVADIRGSYGGRGSAKTRTFAKMTAIRAHVWAQAGDKGIILCGRQFMNSLADSSLEEIKAAIEETDWLRPHFDIGEKYVRTACGRISYTFSGLDRNIDSIKSKSRIRLAWVDEAEPVLEEAWVKLIPTLREEDSELWVTWNPESKRSATHKRFREAQDPLMKIVEMNWRDNPWFPAILDRKRLKDERERPEQYDHIWEGGFKTVTEGAYFAPGLLHARQQGRISNVSADPLMTYRAFWDIGGTGAKADACAIWIAQFIGREIRVLDYYEASGQPLAAHVNWLRSRGYEKAKCILPHDGATNDKVYDVSYESALRDALFEVDVIPNQGKGAASARIEAARRLFPACWFNAATTEAGREALGAYHEKRDDERGIGLGPNHDWSSHGCFHGHTEVLTRYGTQRMMDLPDNGEVLTPCGWKPYVLPRITLKDAPLVEVVFAGGYSVKCTPDHLFLTASGWKSAESLLPDMLIQSCWTRSHSISTGVSTASGRAARISRGAASHYTARRGLRHLARSLMGVTSTIATETLQTIGSKIWSAWGPRLTFSTLGEYPRADESPASISATRLAKRPPNGTAPKRGDSGTAATLSAARVGLSGSANRKPARPATSPLTRWFGKAGTHRSIAATPARPLHIESEAEATPLLIASVRRLNETADVWDITVPDGHCFSLANGAVVHNSDAFGLMCIAYEEPQMNNAAPRRRIGGIV